MRGRFLIIPLTGAVPAAHELRLDHILRLLINLYSVAKTTTTASSYGSPILGARFFPYLYLAFIVTTPTTASTPSGRDGQGHYFLYEGCRTLTEPRCPKSQPWSTAASERPLTGG